MLNHAFDDVQQKFLNAALDISNIDAVLASWSGSGEKVDISSCLIHIPVKNDFHSGPYQFVSDYVAMRFTTVFTSEIEIIL